MKRNLSPEDKIFFKKNPCSLVRARLIMERETPTALASFGDPQNYIGGAALHPTFGPYTIGKGSPVATREGYAVIITHHERAQTRIAKVGCTFHVVEIWPDLVKIAKKSEMAQIPAKAQMWADLHLYGHVALDWAMHVAETTPPNGLLECGLSASEWIIREALRAQSDPAQIVAIQRIEAYANEQIDEAEKVLAKTRNWPAHTASLRPLQRAIGDALYPYGGKIDFAAFKRALGAGH